MKKVYCLLSIIYCLSTVSYAQIKWMPLQEALDQTKKPGNKKKVFIDAYTDWCGWCKRMDQTSFKDSAVAAYMNKYYLPVKFDAESFDTIVYREQQFLNTSPGGTKKRGRGTPHGFAVALLDGQLSYPSYILLDEKGNRITIYKGYIKTAPFLAVLTYFGFNQHQQFGKYLYDEFKRESQQTK